MVEKKETSEAEQNGTENDTNSTANLPQQPSSTDQIPQSEQSNNSSGEPMDTTPIDVC